MKKQAIGFFDSGVGGLTVVREAMKQLPNESIYYIGDNARCPYGPRPKEEVIEFTWELTQFLLEKNIKMLVIACNTATAVALDVIRKRVSIPVIGVILPGSRAALKYTHNHKIAVIGTEGTIRSNVYEQILLEKNAHVQTTSLSCPKFVPLVESNQVQSSIAKKVVFESLQPLTRSGVDTLILGCTHYPLLAPLIQNVMGENVRLVDSGAETVSEVSTILDYYGIASKSSDEEKPEYQFYTTGSTKMFQEIASSLLGLTEITVNKANVVEI